MHTNLSGEVVDKPRNVHHLFDRQCPSPSLRVSVVVPVRNEAHHLRQTLDALRQQQQADGQSFDPALYEVLLLANNCTDGSYDIATRYQQQYPDFALHLAYVQLPPAKANIGTVRRLLMDEAHRRLSSTGRCNGIIASTDGDTVVGHQWIYQIIREIDNGSDAVGGRILTHPDRSPGRLFHLRDVMYRTLVARAEALLDPRPHDPWPRHFQHFGASLAVTCQMYVKAGRLPEEPFLEDEAFYRALLRADARVRQTPHVKVFTSTRLQGRVAIGFSEQLRCWNNMNLSNQCQLAEPAEAVLLRLRNRQRLRACWQMAGGTRQATVLASIAHELLIDPAWLLVTIEQRTSFGQLWEKVEQQMAASEWASRWPPVSIARAIQDLREHLAKLASA